VLRKHPGWVQEVVLVGGSTRIPKIQSMLKELLPNLPLSTPFSPDDAIAGKCAAVARTRAV
jgi:molecular chaperone DnaK (HSP70)